MKLTYRGIDFDPTQAKPFSLGNQGSKYRGLDWRFRHLSKPPVLSTTLDMQYRGLAYKPVAKETPQPVTNSLPTAALARQLLVGHHRDLKFRQQSLLLRSAASVGPLEHIDEYWTRIQGKVQPTFRETLDRSHATMS